MVQKQRLAEIVESATGQEDGQDCGRWLLGFGSVLDNELLGELVDAGDEVAGEDGELFSGEDGGC